MFPLAVEMKFLVLILIVFAAATVNSDVDLLSGDFSSSKELSKEARLPAQVDVGVLLDMNSGFGSMSDVCLSMALNDFYELNSNYSTRLVLHKRHSQDAASAALTIIDLVNKHKVVAILGPQTLAETTVSMGLGRKFQVPFITFSVPTASISPAKHPYFVRAAHNDSYQVQALTELIHGFIWHEVVLIYEDNLFGNDIIIYLTDVFMKSNINITYECAFHNDVSDLQISEELNKMRGLNTQVFLVHVMNTSLGSRLFHSAKDVGLMIEGYAWIITDSFSNSLMDLDSINSMQGVLGIRPYIPMSTELANFKMRWKQQFHSTKPHNFVSEPNIYGLWAYDTICVLANAVEDSWPIPYRLLNNILNPKSIRGLSGEFHIVNGQLEPTPLEIFNVLGHAHKVIGFWNPKYGISRSPFSLETPSSSSVDKLMQITWPGDSTVKPLGLSTLTLRKLKIGVPMKVGFPGLVQLQLNQTTNETMYSGYCIDTFKAVVDTLHKSIKFDYELIHYPFDSSSNYDEFLYQVYNKEIDAMVGDTTILADRGYVDFTMPYSDSDIAMIVPITIRPGLSVSRYIFFFVKPFSLRLWGFLVLAVFATLLFLYIFHRAQNQNAGNMWHHLRTQMASIFGNGDSELDFQSIILIMAFAAVAPMIVSVYAGSFSSHIIADYQNEKVNLNANDVYIGYQNGSIVVRDLLLKELKVDESRIKGYATLEQYDLALSKGSAKGGVSAIVDETPYLKLFLGKYGSKYKLDGRAYKSMGFAFAFPLDSPLVWSVSKGIINITLSGEMEKIKQKYLGVQASQDDQYSGAYQVDVVHFIGLFFFMGIICVLLCLTLPQVTSRVKHWVFSIPWLQKLFPSQAALTQTVQLQTTSSQAVTSQTVQEQTTLSQAVTSQTDPSQPALTQTVQEQTTLSQAVTSQTDPSQPALTQTVQEQTT